jgi:3-dehydroquinate dehydratase-2
VPIVPTILVLNGPNLNLLGDRDPDIYGTETLANIEERCRSRAAELDLAVDFRQSNSEGELVDWIQDARASSAALIINPAAYTHSSIAIMDALSVLTIPVIELHLSNIHRRESFRRRSYVSKVATGVICGFGSSGYEMAVDAAAKLIGTGGKR